MRECSRPVHPPARPAIVASRTGRVRRRSALRLARDAPPHSHMARLLALETAASGGGPHTHLAAVCGATAAAAAARPAGRWAGHGGERACVLEATDRRRGSDGDASLFFPFFLSPNGQSDSLSVHHFPLHGRARPRNAKTHGPGTPGRHPATWPSRPDGAPPARHATPPPPPVASGPMRGRAVARRRRRRGRPQGHPLQAGRPAAACGAAGGGRGCARGGGGRTRPHRPAHRRADPGAAGGPPACFV